MIAWLLIPAGILMIVYTEPLVNFTGKFEFAERWFGGGTYTFVKLLGLATSILAFLQVTGGLEAFLASTLGPIIPGL